MSDFRSLQNSVTFISMNGPKTEVQLLNSVKVTQHEIIQGCKVLEILKPTCIALELIIRDESHTFKLSFKRLEPRNLDDASKISRGLDCRSNC